MAQLDFNQKGFSVIEVILASSIFGLIVTVLVGAFLYGQESTFLSGQRARAVLVAEEGLEAVRNIRDEDFSNLTDGTHGIAVSGNEWVLSGSSDVTDIFTRQIEILTIDSDRKNVTSTVSWQQNAQIDGTVVLNSRLTNWQDSSGEAICSDQSSKILVDSSGASLGQGNRQLNSVFIENIEPDCNILIDKIRVTWSNVARNVTRINVGNGPVSWTGSELSDTEIDINDASIANGDGQVETRYLFDGNMGGNIFSLVFVMGDGTTKTEIGITP